MKKIISNSKLKKQLTEVTTVSKILAAIIFISLPFIGIFLGMMIERDNPGFLNFLLGVR